MVYYKKIKKNTGVIVFDDRGSEVNALSLKNLRILRGIIGNTEKDPFIEHLFFTSAKESIFIAGADIKELASLKNKDQALVFCKRGQDLFNRIDELRARTYAIINGACLGGGLELALSCDYIVSVSRPGIKIGFPEDRLGIYPGFGGPHRLISRIGEKKTEAIIKNGLVMDCREAKKKGIVDKIISLDDRYDYKKVINCFAREKVPGDSIDPEKDREERELLANLIFKAPARNALRSYELTYNYKKSLPSVTVGSFKRCGISGSGTMGRDIAYLISSFSDSSVFMDDIDKKSLRGAVKHIKKNYESASERGLFGKTQSAAGFRRIRTGKIPFNRLDLLLEVISEDFENKKTFFSGTERLVSPKCIIGTNTSCISVEKLARTLDSPARFLGVHFFNPAYKMKLAEVIPSGFTRKNALRAVLAFLKGLGRVPIVVTDSPGFLVNRILLPYLYEALLLAEAGVAKNDIEKAMVEFGMPAGPFELLKNIGYDIGYRAGRILQERLGSDISVPASLESARENNRLIIRSGNNRLKMSRVDISRHLLGTMRKQARSCLREGVVKDKETVDLGLILGMGFPRKKRIWGK